MVYLVQFPDIAHPKFFVCLARFGSTWYGCLINSQLSRFDAGNPASMAAVVDLAENDYNFLSHDSYFCADEHFIVDEEWLAQLHQTGIVAPRHRRALFDAVCASETMKLKAQSFMMLALRTSFEGIV